MYVDLLNIPDGGKDYSGTLEIRDIHDRDDRINSLSPVRLELFVRKKGSRFAFDGRITTRAMLACSRCLESFDFPVDASFHLEYGFLPTKLESEVQIKREDLSLAYLKEEETDVSLREIVIEQVLLAVPMKPLCKDDCRGLCPRCGGNLNVQKCSCSDKGIDPRLAPLLNFKPKSGK